MKRNTASTPASIRFDQATDTRLSDLANRFGLSRSEVVRFAVLQKLPEWEKKGVIILETKA